MEWGSSRGGKFYRVGQGRRLRALDFGEGIAYYLFGKASTFTALHGDSEGFAYVSIAAAAIVDRFADLAVGDTLAKAYIHK